VHRRLPARLVAIASVIGCPSAKPTTESSDSAALTTPSLAVAGEAGAEDSAASSTETWTGAYVSQPGTIYVVDGGEWAGVKWRGDDAGIGLGAGKMSLSVSRSSGEVRGTGEGPLGSIVLVGVVVDDAITVSVSRKDPLDRGLTGTGVARVAGDKITGTMRLSVADARVIREATFTLSRGGNP
jgi:hypothetical protein